MNGIDVLKRNHQMATQMFLGLAEDLRDQPLAAPDGGNHAVWCLGHLAYTEGDMYSMMYGDENPLAEWEDLFVGGSQPSDDASIYPSFDEVLERFTQMRARTLDKLESLTDADLDQPSASYPEGFEAFLGTVGGCMIIAAIHPWHHRGQLADARRSLQREPLFA